jgi:branched-chain amino acid transport system substrate-binding protein
MKFADQGIIFIVAITVLLSVLAGGCTTNVQTVSTPPTIVSVGALLPLTGDAASIGEGINSTLYATETNINSYLAATNANTRLHLIVKNTGTTPDGALTAMKELHAEGVKAVVGPYTSAELKAIAPYANESGMVLISYGSTVTSLGIMRDNVFRLVPDDSNLGPALAALMRSDGVQVLVPFVRDDIWGNGFINDTKATFEQTGGLVLTGTRFAPGTTNFTGLLDTIRPQLTQAIAQHGAGSVGILFIGFSKETVPMIMQAGNDSQWSSIKWYGSTATPMNLI